jgi:hypothetical protein
VQHLPSQALIRGAPKGRDPQSYRISSPASQTRWISGTPGR